MSETKEIVIVRRRRDSSDLGHHGGVWKVAFADFMTAMMAFFLVLWIVNSTSKETRSSIARYFNPIRLSDTTPARKGLQDPKDTDFDARDPKASRNAATTIPNEGLVSPTIQGSREPSKLVENDNGETPQHSKKALDGPQSQVSTQKKSTDTLSQPNLNASTAGQFPHQDRKVSTETRRGNTIREIMEVDQTRIQLSMTELFQSENQGESGKYPTVHTEITDEGILISIGDLLDGEMFQRGSTQLNRKSIEIIEKISHNISANVKGVVLSGYTDSLPIRNDPLGNWRLSVLRADTAMRALVSAAPAAIRIERIDGYADTKPKPELSPQASENRRIQILLRYPDR